MSTDPQDADATQRKIDALVKKVETEEIQVPIHELLTPEFLQSYSSFRNVNDMFANSGFFIETAEDFARIPQKDWDAFIRAKTSFSSWKELSQAAGLHWAKNKVNG